ncbi:exodeoxyribonuclease V subunit alpha [Thalassotalea sp. ND16A]|uniref:exodeoxyribonuclease V subunit alpha n=1 Tax=Thalassotalea sp. ND16A TaxID=1535422 RepID=UPI00051CE670|nr:exodeoxyribonuclease V subunit alpha [Thalassotalea sp. ND16A]KGJ99689.1 Exodeoxyribonuclease V [Thalassotalea sp. ND16A]
MSSFSLYNKQRAELKHLPYTNFYQLQATLEGIEAIDYYLAEQLIENVNTDGLAAQQISCLFHLFLALSVSQRDGHSCLAIQAIANTTLWASEQKAEQGELTNSLAENKVGYHFHQHAQLCALLEKVLDKELTAPAQSNRGFHGEQLLVIFEYQQLYLRRYWQFEQELAQFIHRKIGQNSNADRQSVEQAKHIVQSLFTTTTGQVDWQLSAVCNALNKTFSIIAGGPGTGKTYTVTKLLAGLLMQCPDASIAMVAPTGKAAQRLSESIVAAVNSFGNNTQISPDILARIPTTASTIHRLLGVIKNSPNFRHHQHNLLALDVLLIDEVSMVDLPMMTRVFRALPEHCRVILLGDADQLPSVATGSVLADLAPWPSTQYSTVNKQFIESCSEQELPDFSENPAIDYLTYLTFSRRFSGEGGIGSLAKLTIAGHAEQSWLRLTSAQDAEVKFINNKSLTEYINELTEQFYQPIFKATSIEQAFTYLERFRILAPTRAGEFGLQNLNLLVEQQLLKLKCMPFKQELYHGRPIMISQNHYGVNLYNGDIGLLFNDANGKLMAYFADNEGYRAISIARLPAFETVFAMTIHKTQGSEFENVAIILPQTRSNRLLSRELIYTGITRAKKQLQLFCTKEVWTAAVAQKVSRASGLTQRLLKLYQIGIMTK